MGILGRLFGRDKTDEDGAAICKVVDGFMTLSLVTVNMDEIKEDDFKWKILLIYELGAIDCLCQSKHIDAEGTRRVAVMYYMNYRYLGAKRSLETLELAATLSEEAEGAAYMTEGGKAVTRFLNGDAAAPFRLSELLQEL